MANLQILLMAFVAFISNKRSLGLIAGSSSSSALNTQTTNGLQCQPITVTACQGLGYNMTALPNLAGHNNQLEAELRVGIFNIFLKMNYNLN